MEKQVRESYLTYRYWQDEIEPRAEELRMTEALVKEAGEEVSVEYFVLAETFRTEVCQGMDYQSVCGVLLQQGCLIPDKGSKWDCRPRLPGIGHARCYRIAPAIFGLDI